MFELGVRSYVGMAGFGVWRVWRLESVLSLSSA